MSWQTQTTLKLYQLANPAKFVGSPPDLTVSGWADRFRKLSQESSAEPGQWRTDRAPYLRGILDCFSEPGIHTGVVMSSSQVGKSESLLNLLAFHIDLDPCPILFLQPTLEMAESFSKERLAPMLRDTPVLQGKIADSKARDSGNTILSKHFPGGHLTLAGANSPASLASRPVRLLLCDEVDRYPASAGSEGDPVNLARKRTITFWNRLIFLVSTPGIKGASRIEKGYLESDRRRYLIECPHCGFAQALEWSRISYPENEPMAAVYSCQACGEVIPEQLKAELLAAGSWVAQGESKGIAGFHLNELYSPWRNWADVACDYEAAKKDSQQLQVWTNTSLGLPWEQSEGEKLPWEALMQRGEDSDYLAGSVPEGALILCGGVDVQADRLECSIWAWGEAEESWLIGHWQVLGDPMQGRVWELLEDLLTKDWDGRKVRAACIDSGYLTQDVYDQVRKRKGLHWYPIKGIAGSRPLVSRPSAQEINHRGKVLKRGIQLYGVGVDQGKNTLYSRLKLEEPGAKYIHFPRGLDADYYEGLCGEVLVKKYRMGQPYWAWEKLAGVERNEPLDCAVYALAAAYLAGVPRAKWKTERTRLAERLEAKETVPPAVIEDKPVVKKRAWVDQGRGNWVKGY